MNQLKNCPICMISEECNHGFENTSPPNWKVREAIRLVEDLLRELRRIENI